MTIAVYAILLYAIVPPIRGHGRLIEPPSRASAWRYGFDTPHNYNDHELYCGGFSRQWVQNGGKCGVCGDPWDSKFPRAHEFGGTYGQGVIVRQYNVGSVMNIRVELTANHNGYFTFSLCPNYKNTTQECLDKTILKINRPQETGPSGDVRYYPKEGNRVYEMKYRLPKMTCPHCVLQWRYIAGNNWGTCPNGTEAIGCGPQEEFRACADITVGKGYTESPELTEPPELTSPESSTSTSSYRPTTQAVPEPEETYSPVSGIIIAIATFLAACLTFFLLYFHYYQVGEKVKNWIKEKSEGKTENSENFVPKPPPRSRRSSKTSHDGLQEVTLSL